MSETDALVVYCTVPDSAVGRSVASSIVKEGLCACVNQIPAVTSYYLYEGKFNEDAEELLIIKTDRAHFESLQARIIELHPYDVPEIIATAITSGSEAYLRWLGASLREDKQISNMKKE